MYLNLTPKQMVRLNLALAVLFSGVGVYGLQSDSLPISPYTCFTLAIACVVQAYYSTEKFVAKAALSNTITATDTSLTVKQVYYQCEKEEIVELSRISQLKVADNYLAVILDGNGQGYDFQIKGKAEAIIERLNEVLPKALLKNSPIKQV
ncbi:hypothetical protein [Pseudoalteromonas gelatinilytica]|uniref:DUF2244 domain-containing protein n=1 Tax=Pseudoalteromonas gelatinilytica TaxID=1703256 RepID=A0ABQ1TUC8_9GAMM|nr:hypothetical protein [Pseudoalteromonas profundi]GGF02121.1 hypothetical protein GCM10008027_28770 [Pseudoalteromonas profundi]